MFTLNCKGQLVTFQEPAIMGILNITPDSFYEGSRLATETTLLKQAEKMIADGAAILDVGGQSTRPGSTRISAAEELQRVLPAIESLHKNFPEQLLSIDSFYSAVVNEAVAAGAAIVNDVSAGTIDEALLETVAKLQVPYVLTHIQSTPQTMQQNPYYDNVTLNVFDALSFQLKKLEDLGVKDIIVDPGFGFGKTATHNFQLLRELSFFKELGKPLLVGLSRKATVYKTLHTTADKALNGSTVLHTIALLNGANLLRVHDVQEAREAITLVEALNNKGR